MLESDQVSPSGPRQPRQLSRDGSHHILGDVHWHKRQWFDSIGLKDYFHWSAGAGVLLLEYLQDRIACFGKNVPRMEDPTLISVGNPPDRRAALTPDHQDVEDIQPVLWGAPPPAGG